MIADRRRRIQDLVVRMQQAFLDTPAFRLTLPQARRRFATSAATCEDRKSTRLNSSHRL